jgi:hypothetical protein|tara:strand:+ start:302 stop:700 length:399 start_codon:yes stop_codon:yes gene_type:complete
MVASKSEKRKQAIKNGYRSGLEDDISKDLTERGVDFKFEVLKIQWVLHRNKSYTPDFILPNGVIVESKGRFVVDDRMKHLEIKKQHPDLDIRFVFSNSKAKIRKGSKTTLGMWADKHGFMYSDKRIPDEWLK